MNLTQFETQLQAEGYQTVTTVSQPPGYQMGEHTHAFDACALIVRGDLSISVAGVSTSYGVGDIFRLPAGTAHTEHSEQGVEYRAGRRSSKEQE